MQLFGGLCRLTFARQHALSAWRAAFGGRRAGRSDFSLADGPT